MSRNPKTSEARADVPQRNMIIPVEKLEIQGQGQQPQSSNQLISLSRLSQVGSILKKELGYEATMHLLMTFLYIAGNEGCSMQELEKATGATPASNSRNTDWLSYGRNSVSNNGLGLVSKDKPLRQKDRRRVVLKLTPKGKELLTKLAAVL